MTWAGGARRDVASCGSTNDLALAWARDGAPHGALVVADTQTAGRGRHGRTWASPPGRNLYASLIVRLPGPVPAAPLTLAVGVGLCDAIRAEGVAAAGLKWPNDVLVPAGGAPRAGASAGWASSGCVVAPAPRKLAGVLCETAADAVIVGLGVNTNGAAADLPPEVAARATTIGEVLGRWVDREAFLARLLAALAPWIERYQGGGVAAIAPAWEARMLPDLAVRTDRGAGRAVGLDPDGALRVAAADGRVHRVVSGDVACVDPPG